MKLIVAFIQREGISLKLFSKSLFATLIRVAHFGGDLTLITQIIESGLRRNEFSEKFVSSKRFLVLIFYRLGGIRFYGDKKQFIRENRGGTYKFLVHVHDALQSAPEACT
jgi:hypothetical protein